MLGIGCYLLTILFIQICFYSMNSGIIIYSAGGESEIEKISANEVEIRRKELLPVFDNFHSIRPSWNERW